MHAALELFASRFTPPSLAEGGGICISSLTGSADAFLALSLAVQPPGAQDSNRQFVLAITPGLPDADRLADDLRILVSQLANDSQDQPPRILEFPPLLDGDKNALGVRLKTLAAIKAWGLSPYPCVVVASYPALAAPVPKETIPSIVLRTSPASGAKEQSPTTFPAVCAALAEAGYRRVAMVEQVGDYSVRGGIVDAWSPGEEFPVRAEFFGDDLESIRRFDAATQRSIERISVATLLPAKEDGGANDDGASGGATSDEGDGTRRRETGTILDLIPDGSTVLAIEHNEYNIDGILPQPKKPITQKPKHPKTPKTKNLFFLFTGDPAPRGVPTYAFQTSPLPGFAELGADEAHHPELFDAARKRLDQHLATAEARGDLIVHLDDLSGGFEIAAPLAKHQCKKHLTSHFRKENEQGGRDVAAGF